MNSSTINRYRESSAVTSPTKIFDQNDISFPEDSALDAIAKEVGIFISFSNLVNFQRLIFVFNINVNKIVKHVKFDIKNLKKMLQM